MAKGKEAPVHQVKGTTILYIEVIKTLTEGMDLPTYHMGRITHSLSYARHHFATFEKIHGEFMLERHVGTYVSELLVRPYGAKITKHGEIIITGDEKDKLDPVWMEFTMDKSTRDLILRQE